MTNLEFKFSFKWGTYGTQFGQFKGPQAVALGSSDNVYVVDNNNDRIQKFTNEGNFVTKWGSLGSGNGQFYRPFGLAIKSGVFTPLQERVYVADSANHRIQVFTPRIISNQ